jgi:hypothetical protein
LHLPVSGQEAIHFSSVIHSQTLSSSSTRQFPSYDMVRPSVPCLTLETSSGAKVKEPVWNLAMVGLRHKPQYFVQAQGTNY